MKRYPSSRCLFIVMLTIITVTGGVFGLAVLHTTPGTLGIRTVQLTAAIVTIAVWVLVVWRLMVSARGSPKAPAKSGHSRPHDGKTCRLLATTTGVAVLGLMATGAAVFTTYRAIMHDAQARFEHQSERLVSDIKKRLMQVKYGLSEFRGLYAANTSVSRERFREYAASRNLQEEFPGAVGIGFIERVKRADLDAFIASERADGEPDFSVRSLASPGSPLEFATDLYVVKYCFPKEQNTEKWGLDIGSEEIRREAVERAVRTGEPTISGKIRLVQDHSRRTGFLFLLPVYKPGSSPTTTDERKASLMGVLYSPMILEEVLRGLPDSYRGELDCEIFDSEQPHIATKLMSLCLRASEVNDTSAAVAHADRMFHLTTNATIGGRPWTIITSTTPVFEGAIDRTTPALLGVGGTILSVMSAGIIWTLGSGRARALRLAESMTADLAAALRETEALRTALDAHAIVSITDPSGKIIFANDTFCTISGYSREELIGHNHNLLNSGYHPKAFWIEMWKTIASGRVWHGEVCNRAKNGSLYWVDSIIAPFRGADGRIEKYVSIRTDITARKQAEADLINALKDARELAAAIDGHADSVILVDVSGRITRVNPAFERLTGYTRAEAIGQPFESLRGSKTPTQVYEAIWAAIRAGRAWSGRLCHRRARREAGACRVRLPILGQDAGTPVSCEEYWVDASITPVRDADDRVTGFVAIERDVTEAVAAEEVERHRSEAIEARYAVARVLNGMGDLATRLGDAVEITFNMKNMEVQKKGGVFLLEEGDTHLRMFVWRGQFSQEFLRDEAAVPLGRCLCGRAALSGEIIVSDNCFTDHRHENHWPNMKPHGHYIVPLMDHSTPGRASCVGVMFLYTEVNPIATTERLNGLREIGELMALAILKERANRMLEKARAAAENANRAKSAFLANMSHEIRTPLTAILGYADLLREEESATISPEQRTQTIDTIRRAGQHLLTIINDILDLSKIEAGRMSVERIETPLLGVLREVESFMRVRAAAGGLTLTTRLARPLPDRILSDPTRLRQILMNLVGNAVKFTEIGSVTITADAVERDGQSRLVIDVEDTGAGLTEEQASRLFEPFSQADASTTRRFGGTGLGLTICRRLANLMGGDVTLHRTQPGRGSCFRVELPLVPAPSAAMVANLDALTAAPAPAPSQPRVSLRGRILLAEDGPDNQRLIAFHLRNAGAEVAIADNGRIALEMIDRAAAGGAPFDLLLTDVQMPEMDGYTLARTLRERGSTLPIIALTAHAMAEDRERCLQAGCDDFATKPIDKPALLATCARWMGRRDEARATAETA
jgi:PAS domain S-box-containing protein